MNQYQQETIREFKSGWRPLLAAAMGLGTGLAMISFITSVLAPLLIRDNGWAASDFAMVTTFSLLNMVAVPIIGRLADTFGVRRTAAVGLVVLPLTYLAFSYSSGSLTSYILIFIVQGVTGMTTTATVYTRLVVQAFKSSRGLALAVAACGVAIVSGIGAPLLNSFAETHGWRASYQALFVVSTICGIATFLLIPPELTRPAVKRQAVSSVRDDYRYVMRSTAFWILLASVMLCNLPQVLLLSQLKLLLMANGVLATDVGIMFSALALGTLAGRIVTGIALDAFEPFTVAFVMLALPSMGLFVFATSFDSAVVLTLACFCLGFAYGAEGDIIAYLVSRLFPLRIYSSVLGLITGSITLAAALGALLLAWTLVWTGRFDAFVLLVGITVVIGASLLFLLRGRSPAAEPPIPVSG